MPYEWNKPFILYWYTVYDSLFFPIFLFLLHFGFHVFNYLFPFHFLGNYLFQFHFLGNHYKWQFALCYGHIVLSVTLVYCSQTVGWIKIPLGMEVGLSLGDIALDGDTAPPHGKGHSSPLPLFSTCLLWPNGRPQLLLSSFDDLGKLMYCTKAKRDGAC